MTSIRRTSSFMISKVQENPMFSQVSQGASQVDNGKKTVMYFVIPRGETENGVQKKALGDMYRASEAHFLTVQWIEEEDCQDVDLEGDGNILIFDPFGSEAFLHWEQKVKNIPIRVEILGPQVLRYVFTSHDVLSFQTRSCPTYTLAMRNIIVSLSGFKADEKEELEKLIRYMNGMVSSSLTKAVTHVVTAKAITKKSLEASKEHIPLMTADWVRQVWKDNQISPVDASDERYVNYLCPIFYNVTMSMSQLSQGKKGTLKSGIERMGGTVSAELMKGKTDILIAVKASGEKFKFANKWKITCVTPEWVESSTEKGHLLPLEPFLVKSGSSADPEHMFTSTPAHSRIITDFNYTRCSDIMDTRVVVNESNNTTLNQSTTSNVDVAQPPDTTVAQLKAASVKAGAYLDGCKIYVVDHEKSSELKRVLNPSGAIRLDHLVNGVTHVVVPGTKLPKVVENKIKELDSPPCLVTLEWLLQSAKQGSPADEDDYKFEVCGNQSVRQLAEETFLPPPLSAAPSASAFCDRDSAASSAVHRVSASVAEQSDVPDTTNTRGGTTTDISSRVAATTATDQGVQGDEDTDSDVTVGGEEEEEEEEDEDYDDDFTATTGYSERLEEEKDEDPKQSGIFNGISFRVLLNDKDEQEYCRELILEQGGRLRKDDPTVVILPPVCLKRDKNSGEKAHTKFWLFESIETRSLDLERNFLYYPLTCYKKMGEVLKGVVIAVSQYTQAEREYIEYLVTAMGGKYQDAFARVDSTKNGKTNFRSTHLVCKDLTTEKAKAAKRWKVSTVVIDWVIQSFMAKRKLEEERFEPGAHPSSTDDRTMYMPTPQRKKQEQRRNVKGNVNNEQGNESSRTVYPPSTQKGNPQTILSRKTHIKSSETNEDVSNKDKVSEQPGPSSPKRAQERGVAAVYITPPPKPGPSGSIKQPVPLNDDNLQTPPPNSSRTAMEIDKSPTWEEYQQKMAEFRANFPFSEESMNELFENVKARGINLDDVSPFTSFEMDRIMNIDNADSPILLELPRHKSRALKEQIEIALNRTPHFDVFKFKTPPTTPMSVVAQRFNEWQKKQLLEDSSSEESPKTSTPKTDQKELRKTAAYNRFSQGNSHNGSFEAPTQSPVLGITKLDCKKRPSDGSPEDESKSKRQKSSDEENHKDDDDDGRNPAPPIFPVVPSTSKKSNSKLDELTNLINESERNMVKTPSKKKSGDKSSARHVLPVQMVVLDSEGQEEIERPHLSMDVNEDDEEMEDKQSTVKKGPTKPRKIESADADEPEPKAREGRNTSRRKAPSAEVQPRVTRRTRSQSKTRSEDTAPVGHKPIKVAETGRKASKGKKKAGTFPIELPPDPIFMLSSLPEADKVGFGNMLALLGGSISKLATFDPNCSALVSGSLLRSEKILGSIAAGKVILKPEYIRDSSEAQVFLPIEEKYVWQESNINQEKEREIARSSFSWLKVQMADNTRKPMARMKFFLREPSKEKTAAFCRLIAAGGGEVVDDINEATIVIKDDKTNMPIPSGVLVKNAMYLNMLILRDPADETFA